jgi:type I restriction enzyme M protein
MARLAVGEHDKKVERPLRLSGQELNHVTYAIAKMNMIIHDMEGEIAIGDTLRNPRLLKGSHLETFDLVAANPMWNQDGYGADFYDSDGYDRFQFGYPPASTADWGWVQHMMASLNDSGRGVVVLDSGSLSRGSGGDGNNKERDIRRKLVQTDLVDGAVLLPDNLFYNTGAPGILLCLNKNKASDRKGRVVLINASGEFEKGRPKNFIPDPCIARIANAFHAGVDVPGFVRVVSLDEIAKNDFNLAPGRYVAPVATDEAVALEDAVAALRALDDDRATADRDLSKLFAELGLEGWERG